MRQQINAENAQMRATLAEMGDLFVKKAAELKQSMNKEFELNSGKYYQIERKFEVMEEKLFSNLEEIKKKNEWFNVDPADIATEQSPKERKNTNSFSFFPTGLFSKSKTEDTAVYTAMRRQTAHSFYEMRKHIDYEFKKHGNALEDTEKKLDDKLEAVKRHAEYQFQCSNKRMEQVEVKIDDIQANVKELTQKSKTVTANTVHIAEGPKSNTLVITEPVETKVEPKTSCGSVLSKNQTSIGGNTANMNNPGTIFKCRHCSSILPTTLRKHKDGVSVKCPKSNCGCYNITQKPKAGHKWMNGACGHLSEFPLNSKSLMYYTCHVCGLNAQFINQKDKSALVC